MNPKQDKELCGAPSGSVTSEIGSVTTLPAQRLDLSAEAITAPAITVELNMKNSVIDVQSTESRKAERLANLQRHLKEIAKKSQSSKSILPLPVVDRSSKMSSSSIHSVSSPNHSVPERIAVDALMTTVDASSISDKPSVEVEIAPQSSLVKNEVSVKLFNMLNVIIVIIYMP